MQDSFGSHGTLAVGGENLKIARLAALEKRGYDLTRLPYALKILLENLLRREDGKVVTAEEIDVLCRWDPQAAPSREIAFMPARVLLQDFTGVPAVVDLAAMRDAMAAMGGDPQPDQPAAAGRPGHRPLGAGRRLRHRGGAFCLNGQLEFERNRERYALPALGPEGVPQLPRRAARHRHRATRSTSSTWRGW